MKPHVTKRLLGITIGAVAIGVAGWGVAQTKAPAEMMEKMKQMMANRPPAMKQADKTVQDQKLKALQEGKYSCCLRHPCDYCAMKMGQCPCGMNAANNQPVCNECKGGWYAGDGSVPGKKPDDIKTFPRGM